MLSTWPAEKEFVSPPRETSRLPNLPKTFSCFLDRQETFASDRHRSCALLHRKWLANKEIEKSKMFLGAKSVDGFRTMLKSKYGSVVSGWNQALDIDGNGRLSFHEFCTATRGLGYAGNLKALWRELDTDASGFIGLRELDAKAHDAIDGFKKFLCDNYGGNLLKAWTTAIDADKSLQVDMDEFCKCCERMKYPGTPADHKRLFKWLKPDVGARFLTLADLDARAAEAQQRGDTEMMSVQSGKGSAFEWRKLLVQKQMKEMKLAREAHNNQSTGAATSDEFLLLLKRHYGNLVRAWRHGLDCDGNGRISFGEFCHACREMGFYGNVKRAWTKLDTDGSGFISLKELDPQAYEATESFKDLCRQKYGNLLLAWSRGLDTDGNSRLDLAEFRTRAKEMGYTGKTKELFRYLVSDAGRPFITMQDFDMQCAEACRRGDFRMMTVSEGKSKSSMTFLERQRNTFSSAWNTSLSMAQREGLEGTRGQPSADTSSGDILEEFKDMLVRRHGSIARGWRQALDINGEERLSFLTFCNALRAIGYSGNLKKLWAKLDDYGTGHITLEDLDPDAHRAIKSFKQLLVTKYSDIVTAWKTGLDTARRGRLEMTEFVTQCEALGYEGNAKYLFKCLDDGKKYISMRDIDPASMKSLYCGGDPSLGFKPKVKGEQRRSLSSDSPDENQAKLKGPAPIEGFKRSLVSRFGSVLRGWRRGLDADGNGRLSLLELGQAARRIGYMGSVKTLWKSFDIDNSGYISLEEIAPEAWHAISSFRTLVLDKFGCVLSAWCLGLDLEKRGNVPANVFKVRVENMKYQGSARALFGYLLGDPSRKHLVQEDLDVLLIGLPRSQAQVAWAGEAVSVSPERETKTKDLGARTLEDFKAALKTKFGNLPRAWKLGLDSSGDGRLSFTEFATSVRAVGYQGNIKKLWAEFDLDQSGFITLEELDPEANTAIVTFKKLCSEKHGNMLRAWRDFLDKDGNDRLDLDEFCERSAKLGYEGNAKKLFRWFQSDAAKCYLSLKDVDVAAAEARYRGDDM